MEVMDVKEGSRVLVTGSNLDESPPIEFVNEPGVVTEVVKPLDVGKYTCEVFVKMDSGDEVFVPRSWVAEGSKAK